MRNCQIFDDSEGRRARYGGVRVTKESPGTRPGLEGLAKDSLVDYLHCVGAYLAGSVPRTKGSLAAPAVAPVEDAQAQSTLPPAGGAPLRATPLDDGAR